METEEIFGIRYAVGDVLSAVSTVLDRLDDLSGGYICFSNVLTVATAVDNSRYKEALNSLFFHFFRTGRLSPAGFAKRALSMQGG